MNHDRFLQVAELFDQAHVLDDALRASFLDASCAGDPTLRREVELLLAENDAPSMPDLEREELLTGAVGRLDVLLEDPFIGKQLGHFRVIRRVGEGGMGNVYLGERTIDYEQQVAIKVVRHGISHQSVLRRFQEEMRIQAVLSQHPQIVGILDAGVTDDGRPYLVMEFVNGEQIDEYCKHHRLTIRQRLEIFQSVCDVVQFAHQYAVIHRDLKPNNVLVSDDGVPRLIDFGIAKLTDADDDGRDSVVTQPAQRIFTPNYASPEQAGGGQLTTASDVYSLGVLLYELLTGRRPYEIAGSSDSAAQAILAATHSRPSEAAAHASHDNPQLLAMPRGLQSDRRKRARELSGDLDNIVLMAMRKEPERRYATVAQLSEDIRRYMTGLPVVARPDTLGYRWEKFLGRNRVAVVAAALVVTSLVAGVVGTTWQWFRAEKAAQSASLATAKAQEAATEARKKERQALWQVYRVNMAMVAAEFERGDVVEARRRLKNCPAEARNWEWYYYDKCTRNRHFILGEATNQVSHAVFFQNSSKVITSSWDGTLRTWDVRSGQQLSVLQDDMGQIGQVVGSPDGRFWASSSYDGFVRVWDADKETVVARLNAGRCYLAFRPDGAMLATASFRDHRVRLWNTTTGEPITQLSRLSDDPPRIAFSADGKRLAYSSERDVIVWDPVENIQIASLEGHSSVVNGLAFSHDSQRLVTGGAHPCYDVRLWNVTTGELIAEMPGHTSDVVHASFNRSDDRIATASLDSTIRLWNGITGQPIRTMDGHRSAVSWSDFSPDGAYLASGSYDQTVRLWDGQTGAPLRVLAGHSDKIHSVAFSSDSRWLISCSADTTARLWDLSAPAPVVLRGHGSYVYAVAWLPTHARIASASWDGTVRTWDATTGQPLAVYEVESEADRRALSAFESPFFAVDSSHDGSRIAAIRGTGAVHVWDIDTGRHQVFRDMAGGIVCSDVEFLPDDNDRLVYQKSNGVVTVRSLVNGEQSPVCQLPKKSVYGISVSRDGSMLALGLSDGTVQVWDLRTKRETAVWQNPLSVSVVQFSSNGRLLASGHTSGLIRIWDMTSGQQIAELRHPTAVYGLAFSPDGTRLATGGADSMIRLWDTRSWQSIVALAGHEQYVHSLQFSTDGSRLISGSGDHTVRIWNASSEN